MSPKEPLMSLSTQDSTPSDADETPPDGALVAAARAGDARAFDQLCQRYYPRIGLFLARMVGNDEVGGELTQETFLKAWQALPGLRDEARFASWLYRIAANIARDFQRRARLIRWLPLEEYQQQGATDAMSKAGPEQQVEDAELLKQALAQVSVVYRACVILYVVEDLPQPQIAERLGIKPSYVSNYVSRGLAELRQGYLRLAAEPAPSEGKGKRHD
jgi:RNA polymerase sigma-70 factor (ECF subfamily)